MFERNRIDSRVENGTIAAKITLDDGRQLTGKFVIPINKSIFDVLNSTGGFIEFEPFEGEGELISKHTLRAVQLLKVPRAENLPARLRNLDGFDPHTILGVRRGAQWNDIRQAYIDLARAYHPDRYSTAQLPEEVKDYLASMARRINSAYGALEQQREKVMRIRAPRAEPVYTSQPRR